MAYFKVALFAVLGAVGGAALWIVVALLPFVASTLAARATGNGGVGFVSIGSGSVLLAALIGFLVAAVWASRRFVLRA